MNTHWHELNPSNSSLKYSAVLDQRSWTVQYTSKLTIRVQVMAATQKADLPDIFPTEQTWSWGTSSGGPYWRPRDTADTTDKKNDHDSKWLIAENGHSYACPHFHELSISVFIKVNFSGHAPPSLPPPQLLTTCLIKVSGLSIAQSCSQSKRHNHNHVRKPRSDCPDSLTRWKHSNGANDWLTPNKTDKTCHDARALTTRCTSCSQMRRITFTTDLNAAIRPGSSCIPQSTQYDTVVRQKARVREEAGLTDQRGTVDYYFNNETRTRAEYGTELRNCVHWHMTNDDKITK